MGDYNMVIKIAAFVLIAIILFVSACGAMISNGKIALMFAGILMSIIFLSIMVMGALKAYTDPEQEEVQYCSFVEPSLVSYYSYSDYVSNDREKVIYSDKDLDLTIVLNLDIIPKSVNVCDELVVGKNIYAEVTEVTENGFLLKLKTDRQDIKELERQFVHKDSKCVGAVSYVTKDNELYCLRMY